jgi:hypothetical protein
VFSAVALQWSFKLPESYQYNDGYEGGYDSDHVEASATGHADAGYEPDGGGGGQPVNAASILDNSPGTQKADAGHHLSCDSRAGTLRGDAHAFGDDGEDGGTKAYEDVRPQSGSLTTNLTLNANRRAQNDGENQSKKIMRPDHLLPFRKCFLDFHTEVASSLFNVAEHLVTGF